MNEDHLRSSLQALDRIPVGNAVPPSVIAAARRRRSAYLLAGGAAVSLMLVSGLTIASSMTNPMDGSDAVPPAAAQTASPGDGTGWRLTPSVDPSRIGDLLISVSGLRQAPVNDARPWREHDVVFENLGSAPLHFDDTRSSVFLSGPGDRVLLAGDEGCGYSRSAGDGVEDGACTRHLDALVLGPGESASRTITLWTELEGMSELREGTYVWSKDLRFAVGDSPARTHELTLTYEVVR